MNIAQLVSGASGDGDVAIGHMDAGDTCVIKHCLANQFFSQMLIITMDVISNCVFLFFFCSLEKKFDV